jgi:hypothetical protein
MTISHRNNIVAKTLKTQPADHAKRERPEATGPPGLQTKQDDEVLPDKLDNRIEHRMIRCQVAHRCVPTV